jgi:ATP-dependent RNA helicase DeaD
MAKRTRQSRKEPTPTTSDAAWQKLGLQAELVEAVREAKFGEPTEIQRELIPVILAGRDCLGQAKTGTGKTAAFALPILQLARTGEANQALVLVPTRELAAQVDSHFHLLGARHPLKTALLYGGHRIQQQVTQLKRGPEIVIGTPGRILDLMQRRELNVSQLRFVVLDEVDRMLDIGFRDDIRRILKAVKSEHQTIFVSATIDEEIHTLARPFTHDAVEIDVSHDTLTVENINQGFVSVDPHHKFDTLLAFLKHEKPHLAIVFTNTKHAARRVAERLKRSDVNCKEIHGDLMQSRRERVMKSFRAAQIQVLVATDLASRGLDVMEVSHIVNYDVPEDPSGYVHRVGRTARMGQSGYAVSFVTPEQGKLLTDIEKLINRELPQFDEHWVMKRKRTISPEGLAASATPESAAGGAGEHAPEYANASAAPVDLVPTRYKEAIRRCAILESHGLKPLKRTLGSRFRSTRRRR